MLESEEDNRTNFVQDGFSNKIIFNGNNKLKLNGEILNGATIKFKVVSLTSPRTFGELVNEIGMINGRDTGLEERETLTREEMVTTLNILNINKDFNESFTKPEIPSFSDVPRNHWAYKDIEFSKAAGIIIDIGNGMFGLDQKVTANQAAQLLAELIG